MDRRKWLKKGLAVALSAAMTVGTLFTDGLTFTARAEAAVTVSESGGYAEGAYVEWGLTEGADGYEVYISQDQANDESWVQLDDNLIRKYVDGDKTYMRADVLGLTAGTWYVKIVAGTYNSLKERQSVVAEKVETVTVTAQDRSGFAWTGGTASGAYKEDGSLKDGAVVLYVTEKTKDKVSILLDDGKTTATGIQNIFNAYAQGTATAALDVRILGKMTDPATLVSGDLKFSNKQNKDIGVTIEGVGKDATISGFGLVLEDASNVEVRNLGFMLCDSQEGDSVSLVSNNDHIWVHNCDLFYGMANSDDDQKKGDGAMDSKKSNYVTFSYNHFWDCGKSCLLGLEENEANKYYITYHHNWFDHSDSRHPRVRYYTAHVYNNYFDGNSKYGIGATCGSSIFAENNYFRNCVYPMKSSQQGSDKTTFQKVDKSGYEDGGIIKAYGNYMTGQTGFINGNTAVVTEGGSSDGNDKDTTAVDAASFDAYVVSTRTETVPSTVVTRQGGTAYNNFDTAEGFYSYNLTKTPDVPDVVKAGAGRVNGGDLKWTFDNATDDASYDVNEGLLAKLTAYESKLFSIGGILSASVKVNCKVTFDPNNGGTKTELDTEVNQPVAQTAAPALTDADAPEGYVQFGYWYAGTDSTIKWDFDDPVTGDTTFTAKWFTQAEADAEKRGGTPIGTEKVQHSMIESGFGSAYFEINGDTKHENGTSGTYEGFTGADGKHFIYGRDRLVLQGTAYVKFTTTTEKSLLVILLDKATFSNALVDGESVTATSGIAMKTLAAGEHIITSKSANFLYGIVVEPGASVPGEGEQEEANPDNLSLNVGEDMEIKTYDAGSAVKGFTITSAMTVDSHTKTADGVGYSARLKTGGAGSAKEKSVQFTAKYDKAELYIVAASSSSSATRNMVVTKVGADGSTSDFKGTVAINGKDADCSGGIITVPSGGDPSYFKLQLPEAGDYAVYSADGGLNFYAIKVTYSIVYTVTFESNGGSAVAAVVVNKDAVLTKPEDPVWENHAFGGWYTDAECKNAYDFTQPVTASFTLYALWNGLGDIPVPDPEEEETGLVIAMAEEEEDYVYTGSAIKPAITVTNNGKTLKEGVDYTVKYSNNINASADSAKKPTITVTGKGNLTGSDTLTFEIGKKNIEDEDVTKGDIVAESTAKANAVLCYNGLLLKKNKDYLAVVNAEEELMINGIGNYTGSISIPIDIRAKSEIGKFKVTILKGEPLVYNGGEQYPEILVTDAKDKTQELNQGSDYEVVYSNNINAGSAKMTIIGMGDYSGVVTKKYTIKPQKTTADADIVSLGADEGYAYVSTGVTIDEDIQVSAEDGTLLVQGRDYKLTYSKNKKVGQASYKVTFLGNYKGSKALTGSFTIKAADLSEAKVVIPDKVNGLKAGGSFSVPYVSMNDVMLKKSDYTYTYYLDEECKQPVAKNTWISVPESEDYTMVYVKIEGKGNYAGSDIVGSYKVCASPYTDLSKAKVTVVDASGSKLTKMAYTGGELQPAVQVTIGGTSLKAGEDYTVSYIGNVNKGKATVVVTGTGTGNYAGSKTATFSITAGNVGSLKK